MELVSPVRPGFHDGGERGGPVGGAEDEEVRDEVGVPEGGSVGDGSALFDVGFTWMIPPPLGEVPYRAELDSPNHGRPK